MSVKPMSTFLMAVLDTLIFARGLESNFSWECLRGDEDVVCVCEEVVSLVSAEKIRRAPHWVPHRMRRFCMVMQVTSSLEFRPAGKIGQHSVGCMAPHLGKSS